MTVSITSVNTSIENFLSLYNKINLLIDLANLYAVTANGSANGSLTTGNAFVNGIFGSNTIVATTIRGGNVQGTSTLTITANSITLGNSTVNTFANSTYVTTSNLAIGNATSGFRANTTAIWLNGVAYTNLATMLVVANNFANVGQRPRLNFQAGNLTELAISDDAANNCVTVQISVNAAAVLGGFIGGSNTHVQFNDSGAFSGNNSFTWNKTTNTLYVSNTVNTGIILHPQARRETLFANSSTTSEIVFDSFFLADYRAAKYFISVKDNTANAYQTTEIIAIHNGGVATMTEYATVFTNTNIATFTVSANSTHMLLNYTGATNNTSVKAIRELISV